MALPALLLIPLLVLLLALAYLALQQATQAWLLPLLQWIFAPRQSFWKRVLLWPVKEIGKGLGALMRYVKRILGGAFFLAASPLARFLFAYAWVIDRLLVGAEAFAKEVFKAMVYLRNVAIPALVEVVVKPVRADALLAKAMATAQAAVLTAVSVQFGAGLASLPWGVPLGLPARVGAFFNAFEQIWDKVWKNLAPRLDFLQYTAVPKIAGRVDDIFDDLYLPKIGSLPNIRTRLGALEKKFTSIFADPLTWLAALLGSVAGIAMLAQVLAKVAPNLFCKNTKGVSKALCGLNENMLAQLLAGTLLFALVLDPRALAKVAEGVTGALGGVIRETAL